jgi:hypothetical protein
VLQHHRLAVMVAAEAAVLVMDLMVVALVVAALF